MQYQIEYDGDNDLYAEQQTLVIQDNIVWRYHEWLKETAVAYCVDEQFVRNALKGDWNEP